MLYLHTYWPSWLKALAVSASVN